MQRTQSTAGDEALAPTDHDRGARSGTRRAGRNEGRGGQAYLDALEQQPAAAWPACARPTRSTTRLVAHRASRSSAASSLKRLPARPRSAATSSAELAAMDAGGRPRRRSRPSRQGRGGVRRAQGHRVRDVARARASRPTSLKQAGIARGGADAVAAALQQRRARPRHDAVGRAEQRVAGALGVRHEADDVAAPRCRSRRCRRGCRSGCDVAQRRSAPRPAARRASRSSQT